MQTSPEYISSHLNYPWHKDCSVKNRAEEEPTSKCNGECNMRKATAYQPIGYKGSQTPEQTFFFMMNSLLYSRMECGYPSNDEFFDEDVNVYIANLLTSMVYRGFKETSDRYVIPYDTFLYDNARLIDNPRIKYELYKTNADNILVSLGIFKNARGKRQNSKPQFNIPDSAYIGRAKIYYRLAQSYSYAVFRKNTAIADILGKLSDGLEKYLKVLSVMSVDYLNFVKKMSQGELFHLENSIKTGRITCDRSTLYDEFLDALSEYRKRKTKKALKSLKSAVSRLKLIDPDFSFEIPDTKVQKR